MTVWGKEQNYVIYFLFSLLMSASPIRIEAFKLHEGGELVLSVTLSSVSKMVFDTQQVLIINIG